MNKIQSENTTYEHNQSFIEVHRKKLSFLTKHNKIRIRISISIHNFPNPLDDTTLNLKCQKAILINTKKRTEIGPLAILVQMQCQNAF